jgi:DNA-binding response OmpR family regulator
VRILFVEDNEKLGRATTASLLKAGISVDWFRTADEGWYAVCATVFDIILLDIGLHHEPCCEIKDGVSLLRRLRGAGNNTPVLLLTALSNIEDRVAGLNAGADDYLVKPFAIEELVARLRALSRRPALLADEVITLGNLTYDVPGCEVMVGASRAKFSRGECVVLERLMRAAGRVISKAQLGDSLHSMDQDFTDNSIQLHVFRVRSKLAELGANISIRTLRGLGYVIVVEDQTPKLSAL